MAALGSEVWRADLPEEDNKVVVLGTPIGSNAFIDAHGRARMTKEKALLSQIWQMRDQQWAWVMLSQSAVPRANFCFFTAPAI